MPLKVHFLFLLYLEDLVEVLSMDIAHVVPVNLVRLLLLRHFGLWLARQLVKGVETLPPLL